MAGIRKSFGPVTALDGVDFAVGEREVHGLLGGNGAGKTTLMNVLYGLYAADAGTIEIGGRPAAISSPRDAIAAGVGMVHQSFLQVDTFTATENVILGAGRGLRTDLAQARRDVAELSERFGLAVDPGAVVGELPVGVRQRVEILKALYRKARLLILDEPTTNLTPQEVDQLFTSLQTIVDEGMSVILITHKIRETMAACTAMTVMRDGRRVATVARQDTDPDQLAALMVGEREELEEDPAVLQAAMGAGGTVGDTPASGEPGGAAPRGGEILVRISGLTARNDAGVPTIKEVDLELSVGEIRGISGVAGNGQTELAEAITGVRPTTGGVVDLDGRRLTGRPTAQWLTAGVVYVPEDRQRDGILPGGTIAENLVLGRHRALARRGFLHWRRQRAEAEQVIAEYAIRASGPSMPAGQMSGGNIQRMILARAFSRNPRLLVLHNPTRGLDLMSTQFVYERIRAAAAGGCAVVVISEDLDEILALSQRISIMYSGQLVAHLDRGDADPYAIGRMMTGVTV